MKDLKALIVIGTIVVLLILVALGLEWLKPERSAANSETGAPYNLVTTFKGEAETSRAFTWFTGDPDAEGWLEVVKGKTDVFTAGQVIKVQAADRVVTTDRGKRGVHKAEVTGLEPGTLYSFRAGSGKEGEWSTAAVFTTAAEDSDSVTFINVTDSQGETAADFRLWGQTVDRAFQTFPAARFIIHNGDLTEEPENSAAWDDLFGNVQRWVSGIPLMPVTGNHDEVDGKADHFTSHFNLPDNGDQSSIAGTSYSFDYGPVHILVLNTESHLKSQAKWLKKDLAQTGKPWTIVAMHRPAYGGNMYTKLEDWTEIFDEYGVDLVLQGHNHEYSRSYPLSGGKVVPDNGGSADAGSGTVYVVTNASGSKFNEKKEDQFYHQVHFQNSKQMYAGITVRGDTLTYLAYDVEGNRLDEFVLKH